MAKPTNGDGKSGMNSEDSDETGEFVALEEFDADAFRARILRYMSDEAIDQTEMAERLSLGRDFVWRIVNRRTEKPRLKSIRRIAEVMGISTHDLVKPMPKGNKVLPFRPATDKPVESASPSMVPQSSDAAEIPLVGLLEDGNFRLISYIRDTSGLRMIQSERSPLFPRIQHFAFEAADNSMELAGVSKGDIVVCVDFKQANIELTPGILVVVEQSIGDGRYKQRCLKSVQVLPDQILLVPRSTDAKFAPIALRMEPTEDPAGVQIVALAVSCIKTLYRPG